MAAKYVPYDGPIVTREEAKLAGTRRYFTGKPCIHGHLSQRHATNMRCMTCVYVMRKPRSAKAKLTERLWRKKRRASPVHAEDLAKKRSHYAKHATKIKAQTEAGRKRNPEPMRCSVRNYKARKRAAPGKHSAADIAEILRLQRGQCAYCRRKLGAVYDVDHIIALASGGTNDRRNLQIACWKCNRSKQADDPNTFARRNGLLI